MVTSETAANGLPVSALDQASNVMMTTPSTSLCVRSGDIDDGFTFSGKAQFVNSGPGSTETVKIELRVRCNL